MTRSLPTGKLRPVDFLERAEWASVAVAAVVGYAVGDGGWLVFALLILAPDLAMLGYLAGPRAGAIAYNAAHALGGPRYCSSSEC